MTEASQQGDKALESPTACCPHPDLVTSCDKHQCVQHPRAIMCGHKRDQQGKAVLRSTEKVLWEDLDYLDSNSRTAFSLSFLFWLCFVFRDRITLDSHRFSCLCLPRARIKGMHHHCPVMTYFNKIYVNIKNLVSNTCLNINIYTHMVYFGFLFLKIL